MTGASIALTCFEEIPHPLAPTVKRFCGAPLMAICGGLIEGSTRESVADALLEFTLDDEWSVAHTRMRLAEDLRKARAAWPK